MDFNALQHKLFELDPSDPAADKRALIAQAQGAIPEAKPTVDYVNESVEVPRGSMPLGIDSIADFAALAGVRIDEKQKMGSAGQAKGKDPMPKAEPGRTKHPLKDKLVGEAPQGFKAGFKGYNKVDPWLGSGDTTSSKPTKKDTTNPAQEKPAAKPVQTPPDTVAVEPKSPAPQAPGEIPAGTKFYDANGGLHRWEGNMWTTINDEKKWQSGVLTNKKGFALYLDALRNGKAFVPKNVQGGNTQPNRTEDIKARLFAALEAEKSKPIIKPRDPSAQALNDLRKSGAMGAHKDKKKLAKQGYQKHKGKMDESKMSFDDMMKNREFYYTYKQYVRGNANIDQVAELVRGRVDKEKFADEVFDQGVRMGGSKGSRIKDLADIIRKDSNVLDLPGKAFKKIKKFAGLGESYTKVDGMEAEELRKQYAKDWEIRKGKYLYKKVAFDDYNTVLRFLMVIEKPQIELDHFADIKFFYNEAELVVYTHDTKGLTTLDFKLAVQIDRALERMGAKEIG